MGSGSIPEKYQHCFSFGLPDEINLGTGLAFLSEIRCLNVSNNH